MLCDPEDPLHDIYCYLDEVAKHTELIFNFSGCSEPLSNIYGIFMRRSPQKASKSHSKLCRFLMAMTFTCWIFTVLQDSLEAN